MKPVIEAMMKANQKASGGDRGNQHTKKNLPVLQNSGEPANEPTKATVDKEIAKLAGVSHDTSKLATRYAKALSVNVVTRVRNNSEILRLTVLPVVRYCPVALREV